MANSLGFSEWLNIDESSKEDKKELMSKLLASKNQNELVSIVRQIQDKGLELKKGKLRAKKAKTENIKKWMYEVLDSGMKFSVWFENRMLAEMAKKKSQPVVMPKEDGPMIIRGKDIKVATGHPAHNIGTGVHAQGPRRERTRAARNRKAIAEQE
jgi:hypothetical protein